MTPDSTSPDLDAAFQVALVAEVMRKTSICWVRWLDGSAEQRRDHPVWHIWHDGSAYVVSGDGEQPLPDAGAASRALVTARTKDSRARLVSWLAVASTVSPESPDWDVLAGLLQADRLNLPDSDTARARWAAECTITRLQPTGAVDEGPGDVRDDSGAAAPLPTTATTRGDLPWVLHRRQTRQPDLRSEAGRHRKPGT